MVNTNDLVLAIGLGYIGVSLDYASNGGKDDKA